MIEPVDPAEYADSLARRTPAPALVRPGVWTLPLPLPDWAGMESTLTTVYLGVDGRVALIDPGWDIPANRERLETWLAEHGRGLADITLVAASHLHADHLGLGTWLHGLTGVQVTMHAAEVRSLLDPPALTPDAELFDRWGVPEGERASLGPTMRGTLPDVEAEALSAVQDGTVLDAAGTPLTVIHTPGHTSGSLCFVDDRDRLLVTGDHVLPVVRPGLAMGGDEPQDPIGDYLRSLEKLCRYDGYEVLPGHEFRFRGLGERLAELAEHHLRRREQIARLLDTVAQPTVWRIAERVEWTGGWGAVLAHIRRSALAQTEFHIRSLRREGEIAE
ncbi:MAG: MBL fold metallo-hydrolase [Protaetiibacter sp.]